MKGMGNMKKNDKPRYIILGLFGPSGAGKDTILNYITNKYKNKVNKIISYTTRPPRDYEQDGVDYFFISEEEFLKHVLNGEMLEATKFKEWYYGTGLKALDSNKLNVGIFNIEGLAALNEEPSFDISNVYVHADSKIRLMRALEREQNPDVAEICRRYLADEKDFSEDIPFLFETLDNNGKNHQGFQFALDNYIMKPLLSCQESLNFSL